MFGLIWTPLLAAAPPVETVFLYNGSRHEIKILAGPSLPAKVRKAIKDPRYWNLAPSSGNSLVVYCSGRSPLAPSFEASANGELVRPTQTEPLWGMGWIADFGPLDWSKNCRVGVAAGPWKTRGTWRVNGQISGVRFVQDVVKLPLPTGFPTHQDDKTSFPRIGCKCLPLANSQRMADRVEAYDTKGNPMLSAGSVAIGKTEMFCFSLSTQDLKPAKLGCFKYEVRPYHWLSMPGTR